MSGSEDWRYAQEDFSGVAVTSRSAGKYEPWRRQEPKM
jgi:hypothetical protein